MKIRIVNRFHNTEAFVIVADETTELSPTQYRRLRKKLCPSTGCKCFCTNMVRAYGTDDREIEWEYTLADVPQYGDETMGLMGYNNEEF